MKSPLLAIKCIIWQKQTKMSTFSQAEEHRRSLLAVYAGRPRLRSATVLPGDAAARDEHESTSEIFVAKSAAFHEDGGRPERRFELGLIWFSEKVFRIVQ